MDKGDDLLTNYYQIQINPAYKVIRYAVTFFPTASTDERKILWKEVIKLLRKNLSQKLSIFIIDREMVYSPILLEGENAKPLIGMVYEGANMYQIFIEDQDVLRPGMDEYTQLMSRFLKMMLRQKKMIQIGRKFFDPNQIVNFDQFALKVLSGVSCNFLDQRQTKRCFINVDSCFKCLRTQTLYEELLHSTDYTQVEGQIVMTTYNYKFYKVGKVHVKLTPNSEFEKADKTKITFQEYYWTRYKIKIKDSKQPLIEVIERSRRKAEEKVIFLVPEFCVLTGLSNEIRNNFNTMKQLSKYTKPRGLDRVQQADSFIKCFYSKENEELIKKWNLQINNKSVKIQSQSVRPGNILMGNQKVIPIETSNLDRDTQTAMFRNSGLENWAIFYQEKDGRIASDFIETLKESIDFCKFLCKPPQRVAVNSNRIDDWLSQIKKAIQHYYQTPEKVGLFILILPGSKKNAPLYSDLKRFLINECSIPSQVVLTQTASQQKGKVKTICNKLLIQICAKMGGTPWGVSDLPLTDRATMVCGMDVYHKIGGQRQSMLSFVSTVDEFFSRYITQSVEMSTGSEFSFSLSPILEKSLEAFMAEKKILPERVVIYRDGVSNAQRRIVIESEVCQFRQALDNVQEKYKKEQKIRMIVIAVNKKVGAKFYTADGSYDNPFPGTLIDSEITETRDDFYLISQKTTQGTVQPTHYHIIYNEINESMDPYINKKLQSLSYKLCYMYYNYSGSIKIPAPIQYAHTCSNFIGDRYDPRKPQTLIKQNSFLQRRRSLFFI